MKTLALIILSLGLMTQTPANAGAKDSFKKLILSELKKCPTLKCSEIGLTLQDLTETYMLTLPKFLIAEILKTAQSTAESEWPDTILEGPYVAKFEIQIQKISEIRLKGLNLKNEVIGYKVVYQDTAWNTDSCNYDYKDSSSLATCEKGKLTETLFISKDLTEFMTDPTLFVEYSRD